jgi:hypothetical protein
LEPFLVGSADPAPLLVLVELFSFGPRARVREAVVQPGAPERLVVDLTLAHAEELRPLGAN